VSASEGVEQVRPVGRHQEARELGWVRRRVRGLRNQTLKQTPGAYQRAVELPGDLRVGSGGRVDRP
jgi:hypothetical protein